MSQQSVCFVSLTAYGYFNEERGTTGGGAERQLYLLSQELKDRLDVSFVVGDYGQPPIETRDGVTLYRAYQPDPDASVLERVRQLSLLYRGMRRADADTYVYRGDPRKATAVYALSSVLGARWVYNIASDDNVTVDIESLPLPVRILFLHGLRRASEVITQTKYQQHQLSKLYDIDSTIVPNGYPPAKKTKPLDERSGFIWVGRIEKNPKRPHLFLDLAERIPDNQFKLIGPIEDEEYGRRIRQRANELNNVSMIGSVGPDEIHDYYRDTIALVNTSRAEGFPNTFLEAWRQRTPVVSLDVDPGRFVQLENNRGYARGSLDTLAQLVANLSESVDVREAHADPAYDYFTRNLRLDAVADKYHRAIAS